MKKEEIEDLLSISEANCVSVIVPTHRLAEGKSIDPLVLGKTLAKVKDVLRRGHPRQDMLLAKLDGLCGQISFAHTKDGVGMYVSPGSSKLVHFPFQVKEKISVGNSFDSRELLYYKNMPAYSVLSLSKKSVRFYKGNGEELKEVINEDFPLHYEELYEYAPPAMASPNSRSSKAYEKDKSVLKEIRFKTFLRSADRLIRKYIDVDSPVILSGGAKEISDYKQVTKYPEQVIISMEGSYERNKKKIADVAWASVKEYTKKQNEMLLAGLRELIGTDSAVYGIKNVCRAAAEGKGLMLLIEKDLEHDRSKGVPCDEESLSQSTAGNDPVDTVIKTVLQKKGRVTFLDNGMLKDYDGIALMLRYNDPSG